MIVIYILIFCWSMFMGAFGSYLYLSHILDKNQYPKVVRKMIKQACKKGQFKKLIKNSRAFINNYDFIKCQKGLDTFYRREWYITKNTELYTLCKEILNYLSDIQHFTYFDRMNTRILKRMYKNERCG